jgi:hypothetical protein
VPGTCGTCLTLDATCDATTECCGQLVCRNGRCRKKKNPSGRCAKHGESCKRDSGCCAQGRCYGGKCGEKNTHCDHQYECAKGYKCVGGKWPGDHRRCRKRGTKPPR